MTRYTTSQILVPSLAERMGENRFASGALPDDPHAECESCPRCADPEYTDEEIDEMFRLYHERLAAEAECAGMNDPRVA